MFWTGPGRFAKKGRSPVVNSLGRVAPWETTRRRRGEPCQAWGKTHATQHTRHAAGLVMQLSPGGWLSWGHRQGPPMGWENGKNGRDKQWHTTTRVVGRKTHGRQNVVCICYTIATRHKPSRRQRERASNRWWAGWLASGPKPMAGLVWSFHYMVRYSYIIRECCPCSLPLPYTVVRDRYTTLPPYFLLRSLVHSPRPKLPGRAYASAWLVWW